MENSEVVLSFKGSTVPSLVSLVGSGVACHPWRVWGVARGEACSDPRGDCCGSRIVGGDSVSVDGDSTLAGERKVAGDSAV